MRILIAVSLLLSGNIWARERTVFVAYTVTVRGLPNEGRLALAVRPA